MSISSLLSLRSSSDKVVTNKVTGNAGKAASLMLEAGKALQVCVERHPDTTNTKAFQLCGGIGKPHDHATMCRNVLGAYVVGGYLSEDGYDAAKLNDCKIASPIANLLDKNADVFADGVAHDFRTQVGKIMAEKPEDSGKQLKAIRQQISDLLGLKTGKTAMELLTQAWETNSPAIERDEISEFADVVNARVGKSPIETITDALGDGVLNLKGDELEKVYELLFAHAQTVAQLITARDEVFADVETPELVAA